MDKNLFCTGAMLTHPAPDVAHRPRGLRTS